MNYMCLQVFTMDYDSRSPLVLPNTPATCPLDAHVLN